jgi:Tol biopolymer transport system component
LIFAFVGDTMIDNHAIENTGERQEMPKNSCMASALAAALAINLFSGLVPASAGALPVERVSVAHDSSEANDRSGNAAVSADSRFVGFSSFATNLVPADTNAANDIFLYDRDTDTIERVSLAWDGSEANGPSGTAGIGGYLVVKLGISGDGRYVAFPSQATNLVPGDTNGLTDIFVRDRQSATTERVSVASDGTQATGFSGIRVAISEAGRFVAFDAMASNLVDADTNFIDVFVRDRQSATTELISVSTGGEQANGNAQSADLSADGRFVVFESGASNLVAGDANGQYDIFVHDRQAGTTERVSVALGGGDPDGDSFSSAISADGRFVAFYSEATNLVAGDTNLSRDVFVHDRQTGVTERVSVGPGGTEADLDSVSGGGPGIDISADGRYVVFASAATNLVAGDTNNTRDVFLHDRDTGETRRISVSEGGAEGDAFSEEPVISDNGQVIAFDSDATNLVDGDDNEERDIFVVESVRRPQRFEYVAKIVCGVQKNPEELRLVPGVYATTVNIHNRGPKSVRFFKKLALTIPPGSQRPGEIIPLEEDELAYDEALATDCEDLRDRAFPKGFPDGFIEGYVVIQSPAPLEVDAVYTTAALNAPGRIGGVSSIDVERVPETDRAAGCDLVLEKKAEATPVQNPDLPQFAFVLVLYTIEVLNECDQEATNVNLLDHVHTSQPGAVNFIVLPAPVVVQPSGTLTAGATQTQVDGTLSAEVTGVIPGIPPGDTGIFQFWAVALTYEVGFSQDVDLINDAAVSSELFEESQANNSDQTVTPLF